jgi:hypothetical protein
MRASLLGVVLLALAACGDNVKPSPAEGDAAPDGDAAAPETDAGLPEGLRNCLDTPTMLPPPPGDQLPCDLVPPGFGE